ncbi:MAG: hypothetical protein ACK4K7_03240 [Allosphingosinicella sp.]|uniref:hypothetical protein n=1 Tax=Allosphingosinicella sp. TaxID=2823234 RepID=UPI00392303E5
MTNPACAQQGAPAGFQPRNHYEELMERPKPIPEIPPHLRHIVAADGPDRLVVTGLAGQLIEVDIEWSEPEEWHLLADGRYLGFVVGGYETHGYTLVDRAATGGGEVMDTGVEPTFSPTGRWFAAAQMSDPGWGNMEGVAVWEVLPDRTALRMMTSAVPYGSDWRVDRWATERCAVITTIPGGVEMQPDETYEAWLARAPRQTYLLEVTDDGALLYMQASLGGCAPAEE